MTGDIDEPGDKDQVEDSLSEDDEIDLTVDDDIVDDAGLG